MAQQFKRERSAWYVMRRRCLEPTFKDFNRYGGAGITVCPAWMESFAQFLKDMGPAPTQRHWLGRLKVLGNYEPGNCCWTTQPPQERRRIFCRRVSINGQVVTAAEAARSIEVSHATVLRRVAMATREQVRRSDATPAEKRQKLDALTIERNALLKDAVQASKAAQKTKEITPADIARQGIY